MAAPSVTYTFSNGTTSDASQVNQNFTDAINGITDGSKDLTINALTCNGAVSFGGGVTLGDSTVDDVTFTGSLASTINIKTTYSYDIGSATLGLRAIYLGSDDSAARSVKIKAGTVASSYTLTVPTSGGTIGQFPVTNGSGTLSFRYPDKIVTKTSADSPYSATGDESVIFYDASGGNSSITMPSAASFAHKTFKIVRKDSTLSTTLTINRAGSDTFTFNGTTATSLVLYTASETFEMVSDGVSSWFVYNHVCSTPWLAFTPTGAWSSNSTYTGFWRRVGDSAEIQSNIALGGAPTSAALTINVPSGMTVSTAKLVQTGGAGSHNPAMQLGHGFAYDNSADESYPLMAGYSSTTAISVWEITADLNVSYTRQISQAAPITFAINDFVSIRYVVPIVGWNA